MPHEWEKKTCSEKTQKRHLWNPFHSLLKVNSFPLIIIPVEWILHPTLQMRLLGHIEWSPLCKVPPLVSGRVTREQRSEDSKATSFTSYRRLLLSCLHEKEGWDPSQPRPMGPWNHGLMGLHLQKDFAYHWGNIHRNSALKSSVAMVGRRRRRRMEEGKWPSAVVEVRGSKALTKIIMLK